jgi:nucleoid DNA-binding protein
LTKSDIISELVIKSGLRRRDIAKVVDGFLDKIIEITDNNEQVKIKGFGTFHRVEKKERMVNSPIAGEKVRVPAKTVLGFRASKFTEKVM